MLENRFELILRGLIRAGSSHTMSPAAKIKTRSGQIYAMPTFGQVGQSENRCGSGQLIMNKRKNIATGTTHPRIEFISQDYSS